MMKEIKTLQDIADVINNDFDSGIEEVKQHIHSKSREELEELVLRMSIMVSMVPDFLEYLDDFTFPEKLE